MDLILIGLNYKSHSVAQREEWVLPPDRRPDFLRQLKNISGVEGAVFLVTCHRLELYVALKKDVSIESVLSLWKKCANVASEAPRNFYIYRNKEAFAHLVKVGVGMDSMVLGETEILGQLKAAYQQSLNEGLSGSLLNYTFQQTFRLAKNIRTETGINKYPVSLGTVSLLLIERVFGDFQNLSAMVVGLGSMGCEMLKLLSDRGIGNLYVTNRTHSKIAAATEAIEGSCSILEWEKKESILSSVDILISAVAAGAIIFQQETLRRSGFLSRNKKVVIDLGLPRNIEAAVGESEQVYLYNVDDLGGLVDRNLRLREQEAILAEGTIKKSLLTFETDWARRVTFARND